MYNIHRDKNYVHFIPTVFDIHQNVLHRYLGFSFFETNVTKR